MAEKRKDGKAQYGQVRPDISIDFQGYKMVAVGNQVHYSKKWKTFHDFLFDYIKNCFANHPHHYAGDDDQETNDIVSEC